MKKREKMLVPFLLAVMLFMAVSCQTEIEVKEKTARPHVAVLVAEGFHDGEAYMPIGYLLNQGHKVTVIGPERGTVKAYNSDFTINIQKAISEVGVHDFDALILPGGRGPAALRENDEVINFMRRFWETGKVTAAICHGPQVLVTAGILEGRTSTGFPAIQEEIERAGANFLDETVVIDGNLITSRVPDDLHDFSREIALAIARQN